METPNDYETPSEYKRRVLVGVSRLTILLVLILIVAFGARALLSEGNDQPEQQEQAQAEEVVSEQETKQESERFEGLGLGGARVIKDTETGVQYLYVSTGNGGGLTVLVDQEGKPLLEGEEG